MQISACPDISLNPLFKSVTSATAPHSVHPPLTQGGGWRFDPPPWIGREFFQGGGQALKGGVVCKGGVKGFPPPKAVEIF